MEKNKPRIQCYWGIKTIVPTLKKVIKYSPKGETLDLGAGKGKNSLFLAENNFKVTAIDLAAAGLNKLKKLAQERNVKITTKRIDIRKFRFQNNKYALVISTATLDFLKKSEIEKIIKEIKKSLIKGGIVYLLVFSVKDFFFIKIKKLNLKPVEKNTFFLPKIQTYRHFFTVSEFKKYFNDFKVVLLEEKTVKDSSHGKSHFHKIIELIAVKKYFS